MWQSIRFAHCPKPLFLNHSALNKPQYLGFGIAYNCSIQWLPGRRQIGAFKMTPNSHTSVLTHFWKFLVNWISLCLSFSLSIHISIHLSLIFPPPLFFSFSPSFSSLLRSHLRLLSKRGAKCLWEGVRNQIAEGDVYTVFQSKLIYIFLLKSSLQLTFCEQSRRKGQIVRFKTGKWIEWIPRSKHPNIWWSLPQRCA